MAIGFKAGSSASNFVSGTLQDSTISFWILFDTLPSSSPTKRQVTNIARVVNVADESFPLNVAIISAQDEYYNILDGAPVISVDRGTYYYSWALTARGMDDGEWHHVAFVSYSSTGDLKFYLDKVDQGPADHQVRDPVQWTADWRRGTAFDSVYIGQDGPVYTALGIDFEQPPLDLFLADIAVWNKCLTANNVADLAAGKPASLVRQNDLVSFQRLFENADNFIAVEALPDNSSFGLVDSAATVVSSPSSSHAVAVPAGAQAGDVAVLIGTTFGSTFSTPAGWSLRETNTSGGEMSIMTRVLPDPVPSSVTVSCAGSTNGIWHMHVIRGAKEWVSQWDQMETDVEVGERGTSPGSRCIKLAYARTRRTDNTLDLDIQFSEVLDSETASSSSSTGDGRLVSGYRGPEWDGISDPCTMPYTGTTDEIRAGVFLMFAANDEAGISDNADQDDHPAAVLNHVDVIESRVLAVMANGRDTGADQRHDPNARLDYCWDWSDWLRPGEYIRSATVMAAVGITASIAQHDGLRVFSWITGGSNGTTYAAPCRVETTDGRIDDRTMNLFVLDR